MHHLQGTLRTDLRSLLCKIPSTVQSLKCSYCEDFMYSVSQEHEVRYNRHTLYETSNPVKTLYRLCWRTRLSVYLCEYVALLRSWSRCEGLGIRHWGMVISTPRDNRLYDNSNPLSKVRGWKSLNSYSSDDWVPPWLHPQYRH